MKLPAVKFEHISAGIALLAVAFTVVYVPIMAKKAATDAAAEVSRQSAAQLKPEIRTFDATMQKVGDTADAATAFLNQSTATMKTVQDQATQIGTESKTEAKEIQQLTQSAQTLTQKAGIVMDSTNDAIRNLKPVENNAAAELAALKTTTDTLNQTAQGVNRQLPYVRNMLASVSGIAGHWNAISGDFEKVSDRVTKNYLAPVPWWKWPIKRLGETWDIGAAVARHTP
jgi:ABC-type transporter Mla subunit MlaD